MERLLKIVLIELLLINSNILFGQISFINCIDCGAEDSTWHFPGTSVIIDGGVNEVSEGLILVPYNTRHSSHSQLEARFWVLGLNTGLIHHDLLVDSTNVTLKDSYLYNDSTSLLVGRKYYEYTGQDTVVAWVAKLNHYGLSIDTAIELRLPNSRHCYLTDLLINDDLTITAIGHGLTPNEQSQNIKFTLDDQLNVLSSFTYTNPYVEIKRIFNSVRLSNGNILTVGEAHCGPIMINEKVRIEVRTPYGGVIWSKDYECDLTNRSRSAAVVGGANNDFFVFYETVDTVVNNERYSRLHMEHFNENYVLVDSISVSTSSGANIIGCPPVFDLDSNLLFIQHIPDSNYLGNHGSFSCISRLVKMNQQGNIIWTKDIKHFEAEYDTKLVHEMISSINVVDNGDIVVTGGIYKSITPYQGHIYDYYGYAQRITSDGCSDDGCAEYYASTEENEFSNFMCFPNPASNELRFLLDEPYKNGIISIYNSTGTLVLHRTLDAEPVDISGLSEGYYIVRITSSESKIITSRFVINR